MLTRAQIDRMTPEERIAKLKELTEEHSQIRARKKNVRKVADFSAVHERLAEGTKQIDVLADTEEISARTNVGIAVAQEAQEILSRFTDKRGEWDEASAKQAAVEVSNMWKSLTEDANREVFTDIVEATKVCMAEFEYELKRTK